MEENRSLESANLDIGFAEPSLRRSDRQTPTGNRLRQLLIHCSETMDGRALISSIALRRGAALDIEYYGAEDGGLVDLLSGVSARHLPNLSSSLAECRSSSEFPMSIWLLGSNGSFSLKTCFLYDNPFKGFPPFILDNIRELYLEHHMPSISLPSFPSLEVLVIGNGTNAPWVLSTLLPNPTVCSLLKTIAFLNHAITEGFMDELARFASDRENITSAPLHRVVVVNSEGRLPSTASIERLRGHITVVEVIEGCELPTDLSEYLAL